MLGPINYLVPNDSSQQVRNIKKHFNQKYRKERGKKVIKIKLPTFDDDDDNTNSKLRTKLKEAGILPQKEWSERPVFISCTPTIFESYIAPEGDGKFSPISTTVHNIFIYSII